MTENKLIDTVEMTSTTNRNNPLVSIIIPYFNHPAYLAETVESARRQTYSNVEIIVVDDGSAAPADSILGSSDEVLLIRTENRGVSSARNVGFQNSSGEYLIFLDADDRLMPVAVEAHLRAFDSNPGAGMTFAPVQLIDGEGKETETPRICRPRKDYFLMLLESNPIACPGSTMISRAAFIEAGLFDLSLRNAEDYHLYLKLARRRPVVQHYACVAEYRKHTGGKSNNKERMIAAVSAIFDQLENDPSLSPSQRRTLFRGRNRWMHSFRPQETIGYRLRSLYYSFRAMLTVPIGSYFQPRK
jgi:glycosyltransferase involved in cell wall biosynthesis